MQGKLTTSPVFDASDICRADAKAGGYPLHMATTQAGRIRAAREAAGMNQSELARALTPKVSPQTVQHWEKGGGIRQDRLRQVATALRVTPEWLMFGETISRQDHTGSATESPTPSQPQRPDPAMLAAALDWLEFEEGPHRRFAYQGLARGVRLAELYAMIEADGGVLSPATSRALIAAAERRFAGNPSNVAPKHGRKAGPAK
jgi:transcriptional regulator with XRE-family HTH domain